MQRGRLFSFAILLTLIGCAGWFLAWSRPAFRLPRPESLQGVDPQIARALEKQLAGCGRSGRYDDDYLNLARLYQANGFLDLALETYRQYLDVNPQQAEAWYLLGLAHEKQGDLPQATSALTRAAELEVPYPPCYWRLALWKIEAGAAEEALPLLDASDRLTELDHYARLVRAKALLALDRPQEALKVLLDFDFSRTPNSAYANFLRGTALRQLGKLEEAQPLLAAGAPQPVWLDRWSQQIEDLAQGISAQRQRASSMFRAGSYQSARPLLEAIVRQPEADSRDWSMLGAILISENQLGKAGQCYRKAIEFTPADPWLHYHLARSIQTGSLQATRDQLSQGLEAIDTALQLDPTIGEFHEMRGYLLEADGQATDALLAFQQAENSVSTQTRAQWNQVFALLGSDQLEAAERKLQALVATDRNSAQSLLAQAQLAWKQNQPRNAVALLDRLPTDSFPVGDPWRVRADALRSNLSRNHP